MTADGKITTREYSPVDFTSREDKMHLLRQRSLADAVVGNAAVMSALAITPRNRFKAIDHLPTRCVVGGVSWPGPCDNA